MDDKTALYWIGVNLAERTAERDDARNKLGEIARLAQEQKGTIAELEAKVVDLETQVAKALKPKRAPRKRT